MNFPRFKSNEAFAACVVFKLERDAVDLLSMAGISRDNRVLHNSR